MATTSFYKCAREHTQIRTHSCPSASRGAGPRTPSGTKTQGGSSPLYKAMYSIGIKSAHTLPYSSTSNHPEATHNTHYNAQAVETPVTLDCLGDNDKKKSVHVRNRPAVGLATSCTSAALSSFFLNIFISNGGTHQRGTHGQRADCIHTHIRISLRRYVTTDRVSLRATAPRKKKTKEP